MKRRARPVPAAGAHLDAGARRPTGPAASSSRRCPFRVSLRFHPRLRVVQHDKPEMLRLHPEIEREWSMRRWTYNVGGVVVAAGALSLFWGFAELVVLVTGGSR